jgi:hypothetical protein
MSSLIDIELFCIIPNLYITNIISDYTYPNRSYLLIQNIEDCIKYLNYPKSVLDYCENDSLLTIEYFFISSTFYYRIIFSENIVDNMFHYIKDCFDKEELMTKIVELANNFNNNLSYY